MTHILITDLREIRYMAYVPEEPKYCDDMFDAAVHCGDTVCRCDSQLKDYQSDLEKAERESLLFEDQDWAKSVIQSELIKVKGYSAAQLEPGIYQVPVEVEIVPDYNNDRKDYYVARIVDKPKEESQEDLKAELQRAYSLVSHWAGEAHKWRDAFVTLSRFDSSKHLFSKKLEEASNHIDDTTLSTKYISSEENF